MVEVVAYGDLLREITAKALHANSDPTTLATACGVRVHGLHRDAALVTGANARKRLEAAVVEVFGVGMMDLQ